MRVSQTARNSSHDTGLTGFVALIMAFIYTFSQDNANARVTFMVIQIEAKYLPLGSLALTLLMSGPSAALTSASGIVSAHLYDFLTRIWPAFGGGSNWIQTPAFISRLFGDDSKTPQARPHGTAYGRGESSSNSSRSSGFSMGSSWNSRGPGRRLGS